MIIELTPYERQIVDEIAHVFGIAPEILVSPCKAMECVRPRWMLWLILFNKGYSSPQCAKISGHADHTTILHGFEKMEYELMQNSEYLEKYLFFREKYNLQLYAQIKKTKDIYKARSTMRKLVLLNEISIHALQA